MDKLKLTLAVAVMATAVGGFYVYEDQSLLVRVIALLVAAGLSIAIAMQAEPGRVAWAFVKDSRTEIRKVVWPTRKETTQSTMLVIVMVFIVGIFLWLLDMFLGWAVQLLTGQGG